MEDWADKVRRLSADAAVLAHEIGKTYKDYTADERAQFDRFDLFARLFMDMHGIESCDGDWESDTRESLAAGMRAAAGVPQRPPIVWSPPPSTPFKFG